MTQFRVYRLPDGLLALDMQSDLIDTGARVVAPLVPLSSGPAPLTRLEPVFEVAGEKVALHVGEMAAVPARLLAGDPVADLSERDREIRGALDMLFSGF